MYFGRCSKHESLRCLCPFLVSVPACCGHIFNKEKAFQRQNGLYPATWISNLIIAPNFYIAAGLFWNLEHHKDSGINFSFRRDTWYREIITTSFWRFFWITIPFIAFAMYGVLWFVVVK